MEPTGRENRQSNVTDRIGVYGVGWATTVRGTSLRHPLGRRGGYWRNERRAEQKTVKDRTQ